MLFFILIYLYPNIITACEIDECTLITGQCVFRATIGNLCAECGYKGYYRNGECFCNNRLANGNNNCSLPSATNRTRNIERTVFEGTCSPFDSWQLGFWKNTEPGTTGWINNNELDVYVYGTEFPPTSSLCYNEFYLPRPEKVSSSALIYNFTACTQYGGPDPDSSFTNEYEKVLHMLSVRHYH